MHKSTIIQLVLIIIGIFSFFTGLETIIGNFVNIGVWIFSKYKYGDSDLYITVALTALVVSCSYFLLAYFFISRSGRWSQRITEKAKLSYAVTAHASPADLLYFLFVIIGSYMLLRELPRFLGKVFNWFSTTVARNHETSVPADSGISWTQSFLGILVPVLTILLAKYLATYFAGKTDTREDLSITDEPGQGAD